MKAVVLKGPKQLELVDIPKPSLSKEEHALIQVESCGICGSDLRYWAGENPWALHTLGKHVDNPPNMVLGHEFAGTVLAVHSSKYEHLVGKRVGVQSWRACGECALCRSGRQNLCKHTIHIGHAQGWGTMDFYPGAYAEYSLAWTDLLHPLAEHVSIEEEAMRDILGVSVHAVGRARIPRGGTVLCIGGGPAGFCIAQVASAEGAGNIFISDPSPLARGVIEQLGRFTCIDPTTTRLADAVPSRCAAIFDSVGSAETVQEALPLLAESGTYVNLAVHDAPISLNASALGSERTITTSSNAFYQDERRAHELISSGVVDLAPMITHRFPLEDFQQAFDLLLRDPKEAYKVVLRPA